MYFKAKNNSPDPVPLMEHKFSELYDAKRIMSISLLSFSKNPPLLSEWAQKTYKMITYKTKLRITASIFQVDRFEDT